MVNALKNGESKLGENLVRSARNAVVSPDEPARAVRLVIPWVFQRVWEAPTESVARRRNDPLRIS